MTDVTDVTEATEAKHVCIVNRRAPHGSIYAQESLELALITSAFDQLVTVLFIDDGVFQLVSNQKTEQANKKNFSKAFAALPDYDIKQMVVESESLSARGLSVDDLLMDVIVMPRTEIADLLDQQQVILGS